MSVQEYYNKTAAIYDSLSKYLYFKIYDEITWRFTVPYLPRKPVSRILDAAGGTGKWSVRMAREGNFVTLVDMSEGMLDIAREKITNEGLSKRIEVRQGDLCELNFDDAQFDLVFCEHALGFIENQEKALSELVRVLKPAAKIIVSGQNRYPLSLSLFGQNLETGMKILEGTQPFLMRGLVPVHTLFPNEFRALLEKVGIKITKLVGKGVALTPLVMPMEKLYSENYDQELFDKIMSVETSLCERPDALPLAGHIQAIGVKEKN